MPRSRWPRRHTTAQAAHRWISQQLVADAAQRFEQRRTWHGLEFRPQSAHVYVQQIRFVIVMRRPAFLANQFAREDPAQVLHEDLEQRKLAAGQIHGLAGQVHSASDQVELDTAVLEHGLLDGALAAQQGTQTREQFLHAERLREVVIGPQVQPLYAVLKGVTRTQDEYRFIDPRFAPLPQQLETVAVRQAQIEDDRVVA